ncbi:hypothetical protein [Bernardetia sp. MNP-M8]|uniref:hypothetical protein n=1 Tax=Bernardetia sp. MNP-M8 TaxID=3127470 RepID=UPI0030CA7D1E
MKRLFYLISALLFCLGIVFYKQTPTYNPFDDVFDIDTNQLSECDTMIGSCGDIYFKIKNNKRLKFYYTLSWEDMNNVVAKGFVYAEDTILITQKYNYYNIPDSIKNLPIDINEFNKALNEFDYCFLNRNREEYNDEITIIHKTNLDTVTMSLGWHELENDSTKLVRTIRYFKSKPRIIRNANGGFID